jgi:N-carbamoyl-L-amino-acid hydrolase
MNVVPERARLTLEFRAPVADDLARLGVALEEMVRAEARTRNLDVEIDEVDGVQPVQLDPRAQHALASAADRLGLSHVAMPSGAGHDAQAMARICPAGMIFVPSAGGFSHSAREFTEWDDCVNGANVLLQAAVGGL